MNKAERVKLHMNVPPDVTDRLATWAMENASNMTTELVRAVRERARAEREREKAAS